VLKRLDEVPENRKSFQKPQVRRGFLTDFGRMQNIFRHRACSKSFFSSLLGEGTDTLSLRTTSTESGCDNILALVPLQAIGIVAHPRRDSTLDILLDLGMGFAEIGTINGEAENLNSMLTGVHFKPQEFVQHTLIYVRLTERGFDFYIDSLDGIVK
jgi:hypothetical protein